MLTIICTSSRDSREEINKFCFKIVNRILFQLPYAIRVFSSVFLLPSLWKVRKSWGCVMFLGLWCVLLCVGGGFVWFSFLFHFILFLVFVFFPCLVLQSCIPQIQREQASKSSQIQCLVGWFVFLSPHFVKEILPLCVSHRIQPQDLRLEQSFPVQGYVHLSLVGQDQLVQSAYWS